MDHPTEVSLTISEVADKIATLRYDKLEEFLEILASKIKIDSLLDLEKGRFLLSKRLENLSSTLVTAEFIAKDIWEMSKDKMESSNVEGR